MDRQARDRHGAWRIWSHCVGAWWRDRGAGYTRSADEAGIFSAQAAMQRHGRDHRAGCRCDMRTLADEAIPAPDRGAPQEGQERYRSKPPCMECGAHSPQQAETMCVCAGDKDHCHGCELWPD